MEYLIGAGAILEAGENGSITTAALHAQVDAPRPERIAVAAIDFEAADVSSLKRLLAIVRGWDAARFRTAVSQPLRARRECSLADVLQTLATAAQAAEVHLFARWLPDEATLAKLHEAGIEVVAHPLESIGAAAIVSGQRCKRWKAA